MDEFLNKKELIDIFEHKASMYAGMVGQMYFLNAAKMVSLLPPKKVIEIRFGKWIETTLSKEPTDDEKGEGIRAYECSCCGKVVHMSEKYRFCPWCGNGMWEENES